MKFTITIEVKRDTPAEKKGLPNVPSAPSSSLPSGTPTDLLKFPDYRRGYA